MITKVSLKNFKLHASTEFEAAPITVFIGPNNSGKSSIFQALLSLRQAATMGWDSLYDANRYRQHQNLIIDIGDFDDVIRHGESEIDIGLEGTLPYPYAYKMGERFGILFEVHIRQNRLAYHSGGFGTSILLGGGRFSPTGIAMRWEWSPSVPKNATHSIIYEKTALRFRATDRFQLIEGAGIDFPPQFPQQTIVEVQDFQRYLGGVPTSLLNSIHPVFPLRGFEEWGYSLPAAPPQNIHRVGLGDRAVALASTLLYKDDLTERLSEWLEGLLGIGIRVKVLEGPRLTIRTKPSEKKNSDTLFSNEGSGANQLPFVLIPIGLAAAGETILLCEPEAHLHPYGQSELMKLLLKVQKDKKLQFFIETHSEHILHALLYAIAKGDLQKTDLAIYYFKNEQGEAKVQRLAIDEKGRVEGGLPGFFDQSLAELSEYLEALKKT
ncbi:MAG: DUF3696 domain-containing protein [Acidobacteria bacterium]|nr:DUF3696 domain-containing protein [Acidobacteriota bacterium]